MENFESFFETATGHSPLPSQTQFATEQEILISVLSIGDQAEIPEPLELHEEGCRILSAALKQ